MKAMNLLKFNKKIHALSANFFYAKVFVKLFSKSLWGSEQSPEKKFYIAWWAKAAIAQVGITQTAPSGLPKKTPASLFIPMGPMESVQALPIGQAGGAPISARSLTQSQSADSKTPLNPFPERPPLVVKMVTV